ncbi:MAG: hypothetical protein JRN62_02300 [Nitrososphaerota archaeon]|nr:hypothetical protein [Nitrososphaerota archaeon]MDG6948843.1 hypothetical protein [Nitrososphaerota archaeon]
MPAFAPWSAVVKFHSRDAIKTYLDRMVADYQSGVDTMGEDLAVMLRDQAPVGDKKDAKDDNDKKKAPVKSEVKAGSLKVVTTNPKKALEAAMMKIVDDYKSKVDTTNQAIAALVELDRLGQEGMYVYNLVVNKGIPESIIVESTDKKLKEFSYTAKFNVVGT